MGTEPGICPVPATPTPPPTPLPSLTPTQTKLALGRLNVLVFYDKNNNGVYNSAHDSILTGAELSGSTLRARAGDCGSPGGVAGSAVIHSGSFTTFMIPGSYCFDISPNPSVAWNEKSPPISVVVHAGDTYNLKFWYREVIH